MSEPSPQHDHIARQVVDAAFTVHKALGPGLLESAYQQCVAYELAARQIPFRRQVGLPLVYRDHPIEVGYRMDLVVDEVVVVEIKAAERLLPVHEAQLHTYLMLSGLRLGLLINFNVVLIKHGIRRRIYGGRP
jgi:GxxExxY protein